MEHKKTLYPPFASIFLVFFTFFAFFVSSVFCAHTKYIFSENIENLESQENECRVIETIYGSFEVSDPVILELMDSDTFQRMKKIDQYGPFESRSFSRYEHSIGVWALLKKFGASREEQIAGLLHDVSHTVFSHVGDKVFKCAEQVDSYQDNIHEWHIKQTSVVEILKKYNIPFSVVNCKSDAYIMLEQDLPNICVDRLEYNLRGGLVEGLISKEEVAQILADVKFENEKFFFTNVDLAKKFAEIPLYLTEYIWGSCKGFVAQAFLAHALLRAVKIGIITMHDIHFSTDDFVLKVLGESEDRVIVEDMKNAFNSEKLYFLSSKQNFDKHFVCKFRGLDPWVRLANGVFKRLSEVSQSYRHYYRLLAEKMQQGFCIKFVDQNLLSRKEYLEEVFAV